MTTRGVPHSILALGMGGRGLGTPRPWSSRLRPEARGPGAPRPQPPKIIPYQDPLAHSARWLVLTAPRTIWYGTRRPLERWLSGRKRRFAKPLYGSNCIGGSNPPLSAGIAFKTSPSPLDVGVSGLFCLSAIVEFDPPASDPTRSVPRVGQEKGTEFFDASVRPGRGHRLGAGIGGGGKGFDCASQVAYRNLGVVVQGRLGLGVPRQSLDFLDRRASPN